MWTPNLVLLRVYLSPIISPHRDVFFICFVWMLTFMREYRLRNTQNDTSQCLHLHIRTVTILPLTPLTGQPDELG